MIFQKKTALNFQLEIDSKHSKTLFRPNNICLWVEFGWLSAGFPPLLEFRAAPKKARSPVS
jgi:hypothetical protein